MIFLYVYIWKIQSKYINLIPTPSDVLWLHWNQLFHDNSMVIVSLIDWKHGVYH